ncbi:MAG: AmmeMemoRadiSam system protein A, partial [Thermoanaerobaculia bacterium]
MLSQPQRSQLLTIARRSIETTLAGSRFTLELGTIDAELQRPAGAFVSLHTHDGDLRGCIGTIQPVAPLCEAVANNAVNAAFRDPRFFPLRPEELARIHIEISVMSPIETVEDVESI